MNNPPPPAKKNSGRNCLLYGCLGMVVLVLLGVLTIYLVARYTVNTYIERFTAAEPQQFEEASLPEGETEALKQRVGAFRKALDQTNEVATLTLDERELNALISSDANFADFKDLLRVRLEDNALQCEVSMPLDKFSEFPLMSGLKGRHLNASLGLTLLLQEGFLQTQLNGATVKEMPLPKEAIAELQKSLPWHELQETPEVKELLTHIKWLKIEDGKLRLGTGENDGGQ